MILKIKKTTKKAFDQIKHRKSVSLVSIVVVVFGIAFTVVQLSENSNEKDVEQAKKQFEAGQKYLDETNFEEAYKSLQDVENTGLENGNYIFYYAIARAAHGVDDKEKAQEYAIMGIELLPNPESTEYNALDVGLINSLVAIRDGDYLDAYDGEYTLPENSNYGGP